MGKPMPVLSYATPRRERRRSNLDWSGRILATAQALVALLLMVGLPALFNLGPLRFSNGPWVARLAWYWLGVGAGPLNLAAAAMAVRGAAEPLGQQGRFYRRYVWTTLGGFAVVATCVIAMDRWPLFVTVNPSAPAVNDYRMVISDDELRFLWCWLLAGNPILVLVAVRPALRRIGNAWGADER